jgi:hypothetical protein
MTIGTSIEVVIVVCNIEPDSDVMNNCQCTYEINLCKLPNSRAQVGSEVAYLIPQILCNDDSRFLSNSYRSVIGISSYITWCDTAV